MVLVPYWEKVCGVKLTMLPISTSTHSQSYPIVKHAGLRYSLNTIWSLFILQDEFILHLMHCLVGLWLLQHKVCLRARFCMMQLFRPSHPHRMLSLHSSSHWRMHEALGLRCKKECLSVLMEARVLPVIPGDVIELKAIILRELHASPFGGHLGQCKLHKLFASRFFWPQMDAEIWDFCQVCPVC